MYSIEKAEKLSISEIWELYRKYINNSQVDLISSFGFGKDKVKYAEGIYIYTYDNKKIYDFTGGIGVLNLGHNHKRILKVRKEFAEKKKMEVHKNYFSPYIAALGANIAELLPEDLNVSFFPNSGSEAVEGAIKLSYKYHKGKRDIILHSDISFHGKTLGAGNLTGSPETSYFSFPQVLKTDKFIYNDIQSVKQKINHHKKNNKSNIYAIIVETFSASSLLCCSEKFLKELRDICTNEKIVLIFDEIYSGWFKTGKIFYFMNFKNLKPDILLSAKSLGGGKSSISSYTCRDYIFKNAYDNLKDATLHSTTYNGFGEETITAIEAINVMIEDNFESKSLDLEKNIRDGLQKLNSKYPSLIKEIRGSGALHGIVFNSENYENFFNTFSKLIPSKFLNDKQAIKKIIVASIIYELYSSHNILTFFGSNTDIPLKISPSLVAEKNDIDYFLKSLDVTLGLGFNKLILGFIKSKVFSKWKQKI